MEYPEMDNQLYRKVSRALLDGAKSSISTILFLLKIMVPTSLAVSLLGWSGILKVVAGFLAPLMKLIGLPGEAAFVFISGALLNNYSAIAVLTSLEFSLRDATILAVMCLISHNLIVETTVMKSTGSSALKMVILRVGTAFIAAFILNLMLSRSSAGIVFSEGTSAGSMAFLPMLAAWGISTLRLVIKIIIYVLIIMITQSIFEEFKLMDFLSKLLEPFMKIFGLPAKASFLWIVINIVGYAYGAGILKSEAESGRMTKQESDLFNHHAAISHSLLEDTILYSALAIPLFWLVVPRLVLATASVWLERGRRHYFKRSFKVGTR